MRKLLLATLLIGMVGGCTRIANVKSNQTKYVIINTYKPLKIVVIDSCQYLLGDYGSATVLTHKGNCNNPIHKGGNK